MTQSDPAKRPLISVIVPMYNAEKFITSAIQSVIEQTYTNWELILVDNGSTDLTKDKCHSYREENHNIHVIECSKKGPSSARNAGMAHANGAYLFFLDADDALMPSCFELLLKSITEHSADLCIGNFYKHRRENVSLAEDEFIKTHSLLNTESTVSYVRKYMATPYMYIMLNTCWAKLYRLKIIKDNQISFDEEMHNLEDVHFNYRYLLHVSQTSYVSAPVYRYYIHDYSSQSMRIGDDPDQIESYKKAFMAIRMYVESNGCIDDAESETGHLFISYMIIIIIRSTGQLGNSIELNQLRRLIATIVNDKDVRANLKYYSPSGNDSRLIPLLMQLKWVAAIVLAGKAKFAKHRRRS